MSKQYQKSKYYLRVQGSEVSRVILQLPNGAQLVSSVLDDHYGPEGAHPGIPNQRARRICSVMGWLFPNARVELEELKDSETP